MDWKNQELDKQTKTIEEAGSQICETASQIQKARSQMCESVSMINETLKETTKETQDIAPVFVDTNTANILLSIGAQTNPQLKLNLVDVPTIRYKLNSVNITLEQGAFLFKDNLCEFSDGLINFLTNSDVLYGGIEEEENKIKRFLLDIRFDLGKGDNRSSRYKTIKQTTEDKEKKDGRGLTK